MPAPEKQPAVPHPFDVKTIETLVGLMAEHDLSEIDLHHEASRIRLRRGAAGPLVTAMPMTPVSMNTAAPAVSPGANVPGSPKSEKKSHLIKSPTPGTFYAKPSPEEQPYVKVGSKVSPDSVVCKIEAMKIFNDITAECAGVIAEILAENQQAVEYGQPLFRVEVT